MTKPQPLWRWRNYIKPDMSNSLVYKENIPKKSLQVDENAPKDLLVERQETDVIKRTEYLNEKVPEWMSETSQWSPEVDYNLINWYKQKGATVRYTASYFLPVKSSRINQAFYGKTSHAGKNGYKNGKAIYDTGFLGAIDFQANRGDPVYAVLPGTIVYVPSDKNPDYHRVTLETDIKGETYYIEYLHLNEINTNIDTTVNMGAQIGTVGGWGKNSANDYDVHLDFRVYQFKDETNRDFTNEASKQFIDPFELFNFDVQYNFNTENHDYH